VQEFRSANACGRPRPETNELRSAPDIDRLRVPTPGGRGGSHHEL